MPDVTYHCQSQYHQGDRLIHGHTGYSRRIDYRSLDNQIRPHSKTERIVCYSCMEQEWADEVGRDPDTAAMF